MNCKKYIISATYRDPSATYGWTTRTETVEACHARHALQEFMTQFRPEPEDEGGISSISITLIQENQNETTKQTLDGCLSCNGLP